MPRVHLLLSSLIVFCVARKSRVIYGPAVRGKEFLIEPSRGYILCGECDADHGYAHAASMRYSTEFKFTCIEGVWMSVTPTDNELIVALDFEGQIDFLYYSCPCR